MLNVEEPITAPNCPSCDGPMVRRTNGRDGTPFWGCKSFPACRGTRDVNPDPIKSETLAETGSVPQVRVLWNDATLDRLGWQCRYTNAGGRLRSSPALTELSSEFRQCWIARTATDFVAPDEVRRVTGAIRKLVQRGSNPPIHPDAETETLDSLGLLAQARRSTMPGDLSWQLSPDVFRIVPGTGRSVGPDFEPDEDVRLESGHERQFALDWVPQNLGPDAPRWFVPQASFDALTAALDGYGPSGRRVDFLAHAPFGTPFVVEIDGPQHQDSGQSDGDRDFMLGQVGIEAVRIPTSEIDHGSGPNLDQVKALWDNASRTPDSQAVNAALIPVSLHRVAIALLDAVDAGFLHGQQWVIELEDDLKLSPSMLWPYIRLFNAVDSLWGPSVMPEEILLRGGDTWTKFDIHGPGRPIVCDPPDSETQLMVRSQPYMTAFDRLERPKGGTAEIVVRSARLPVWVGDDPYEPRANANLFNAGPEARADALTEILQAVFSKEIFREGQLEALNEVLEGRDCAVLLPTGGGKSLIYQMAGICKPGRTIVIDPLIALMEDQQRGLEEHGIDRVVGISSFSVARGQLDSLLKQVESGDALFIFVAPERLQQSRFRNAMRSLAQAHPINLAVIDEAHCVSEWGHQFRTSYLTLGKVLREVCKDESGSPPPLVALTGTASRAVLKDVLIQLEISADSENSIVRPTSFNRPELEMAVKRCDDPNASLSELTGKLRALPAQFGVPASEFFRPQAEGTYSGLIFCPHRGGSYGILEVQRAAAGVAGFQPAIYSGGPPRERGRNIHGEAEWEVRKRAFADSFKGNRVPLMVSTNAFGMGIDKPNIRYVFHYGMPGSIEAYYQEVGRAGRDQHRAHCILMWNEQDPTRSDRLLEGRLEDVRAEHGALSWADNDSITHQLRFLLETFQGVDVELAEVERLVDDDNILSNLGKRTTVELARGSDEEKAKRERALYRLMLLGVVQDYLVESKFVVSLAEATSESVARSLSNFVQRTGTQHSSIADFVAAASNLGLREALSAAARELIIFIYDVVVESRRRSLREMYDAVRDAPSGKDDLRGRVLAYLTEGDISPVLEGMVDATDFDYEAWEDRLGTLEGVDDARELRGNSARLLVSSPFNPGLLYARAYAEVVHPEGDLQDFAANLEASLISARDRYAVSAADLNGFVGRLLASLESRSSDGMCLTLDVADRLGIATDTVDRIEERVLNDSGANSGIRVVALARRLSRISQELDVAMESVTDAG